MDSINANQPEHNREDLTGVSAVSKIREIVEKADTCFFCTLVAQGIHSPARPMAVQRVDEQGNLWFLSANDSHKNHEIANDAAVRLFFQGSAHSDFLELDGRATISTDRALIRELWKPLAKVWFTGGIDDPRITVIKVSPTSGYYWDTKHGNAIAGMKMVIGVLTGQTLDDSIEGTLKVN